MLFYCRYGGKKQTRTKARTLPVIRKKYPFSKFHVVSPHGLVITGGVEQQQDQDRDVH